jgi:hypothetical protein
VVQLQSLGAESWCSLTTATAATRKASDQVPLKACGIVGRPSGSRSRRPHGGLPRNSVFHATISPGPSQIKDITSTYILLIQGRLWPRHWPSPCLPQRGKSVANQIVEYLFSPCKSLTRQGERFNNHGLIGGFSWPEVWAEADRVDRDAFSARERGVSEHAGPREGTRVRQAFGAARMISGPHQLSGWSIPTEIVSTLSRQAGRSLASFRSVAGFALQRQAANSMIAKNVSNGPSQRNVW